jgi:hypothetical protein
VISFRYHVVTVVAILFALAAGVVLGHGLAGTPATVTGSGTPTATSTPAPTVDVARLQQQLANDQGFIKGVASQVVAGSLSGTSVVLVVAPGADSGIVAGISDLLTKSGAAVTGRVDLGQDAVDPSSRQLVDELTTQLVKSTKGARVDKSLSTYERFGAVLGIAIAAPQAAGVPAPASSQSLLSGLSAGHLATSKETLARNAGLVLLIAPSGSATDTAATGTILASMARGLAGEATAVMVVAGLADGQPAAAIEAVRSDAQATSLVATEDTGDQASGQVAAILGLAAAARGTVGQYGTGDSAASIVP